MTVLDLQARVLENTRLSTDYNVLRLDAPEIASEARPGQFVMLRVSASTHPLLRRPFSIFEILRDQDRPIGLSILNKRIGVGTSLLFHARPDERIGCLGPLGVPFTPSEPPTEAWMVAGGTGLAPFLTLTETLAAPGVQCTLFYGARSACDLFYVDRFEQLGARVVLATEDGTRGTHGRVTVPLQQELRNRQGRDDINLYGCGPEPMLHALSQLAGHQNKWCEVSVERTMGCGLGGCYSCVVPLRDKGVGARLVRSCIYGPVFDASRIAWEE